jgi:hypothetical protein
MSAIAHGSDLVIAAIARMARKWSPPSPRVAPIGAASVPAPVPKDQNLRWKYLKIW